MVGFVDDENVGDFHDPGLDGLHVVTHAGDEHQHGHIGDAGNVDFILAHAHGFDQYIIFARRIEQQREIGGGTGEAACRAAGGHGADEDAAIAVMALHADAIAEDRAAGNAAGGIDSENADRLSLAAECARERVDQRALAGARRPGDADDEGAARRAGASSRSRPRLGTPIFHGVAARASARAIARYDAVWWSASVITL